MVKGDRNFPSNNLFNTVFYTASRGDLRQCACGPLRKDSKIASELGKSISTARASVCIERNLRHCLRSGAGKINSEKVFRGRK
jgi:hypothetical protein